MTNWPNRSQPANWQEATATTITRIQQVFSLRAFTFAEQLALYERAQEAVRAQGKVGSATDYWNTLINSLRILVAGITAGVDPNKAFD